MIIAGGTINGEILIWNLDDQGKEGEGNNLIQQSQADEYFHREPIRKICWQVNEVLSSMQKQITLVTIASDGKILLWNNPIKSLRYPIKGHIFAKMKNNQVIIQSGSSLAMLGDQYGLDESSFIVGTEGGLVQKVMIQKAQDKDIRHYLSQNQNVQWSDEAVQFLGNISDQRVTQKVKDIVDQYMLMRPHPRQVYANHIFSSKPPLQMLYPPFTGRQSTQYDKHHGPVLGISASPFNKRLFLTCSADGAIRIYDIQDKRPVASFEPSFGEYLNCVEWSLFRPAVFACVSNTGNLYIYDLVRDKKKPVETIFLDDALSTKH